MAVSRLFWCRQFNRGVSKHNQRQKRSKLVVFWCAYMMRWLQSAQQYRALDSLYVCSDKGETLEVKTLYFNCTYDGVSFVCTSRLRKIFIMSAFLGVVNSG